MALLALLRGPPGVARDAEQPGVVERERDSLADVLDEGQLVVAVGLAGAVAGRGEHADGPPAHPQRHEDEAAQPEAREVLPVGPPPAGAEALRVELADEDGLAAVDDRLRQLAGVAVGG